MRRFNVYVPISCSECGSLARVKAAHVTLTKCSGAWWALALCPLCHMTSGREVQPTADILAAVATYEMEPST